MDDLIVKTITRLITPFIQLYGIYVIAFGHLSPGGGFAGGSIIGSSMILYILAFGAEAGHRKAPHRITSKIETGGILWFIILGMIGILSGGYFLENLGGGFPRGIFGQLVSGGLIPLAAVGIGLKVASTIITLFDQTIRED